MIPIMAASTAQTFHQMFLQTFGIKANALVRLQQKRCILWLHKFGRKKIVSSFKRSIEM